MYTCCFTGHRDLPQDKEYDKLRFELKEVTNCFIAIGIKTFICGGAFGFDSLAALTVLEYKKKYPHIKLKIYMPYREDNPRKQYFLDNADEVKYISEHYFEGCMQKRNRAMVDDSDICVAYLTKSEGGTFNTVNYAVKKGIYVRMLMHS